MLVCVLVLVCICISVIINYDWVYHCRKADRTMSQKVANVACTVTTYVHNDWPDTHKLG